LRPSCILLRSCKSVQAIDEADVTSRNQVDVLVGSDLDRTVAHLIAHVWQGSACLYQQTPKGVT